MIWHEYVRGRKCNIHLNGVIHDTACPHDPYDASGAMLFKPDHDTGLRSGMRLLSLQSAFLALWLRVRTMHDGHGVSRNRPWLVFEKTSARIQG